jgi:hypothetical protein
MARIRAAPRKMLFPVVNSCRTRNYSCEREFLQTLATRNFRSRIPAGPPETIKAPPVYGGNCCGSSQDAISGREFLPNHTRYSCRLLQRAISAHEFLPDHQKRYKHAQFTAANSCDFSGFAIPAGAATLFRHPFKVANSCCSGS